MRIENNKSSLNNSLQSKFATIIYFIIFIFFVYKCIMLFPIWLRGKDSLIQKETELLKKTQELEKTELSVLDNRTDFAKVRYQKEFFNMLDPGEELIILYENNSKVLTQPEVIIKQYWWQSFRQDFLVWWRNLDLRR